MFINWFTFLFILTILFPLNSFSNKQIELIHSDSVVGYKIGVQNVRDFIGNVFLRQGNIELRCEKATHFLDNNSAILIGNVKVTQNSLSLYSDYIEFNGNLSEAMSNTNISIIESTTKLFAKKGRYNFNTNTANFEDSVKFFELDGRLISDELVFNRQTQIAIAIGKVKLETDSLIVLADTLEYDRNKLIIQAKSNAEVVTKFDNYKLLAGYFFLNRKERVSYAIKSPEVIYIDSTILSEKLNFSVEKVIKYDSLFIFADSVVALNHNDKFDLIFFNNVKLFRENLSATSSFAFFERHTGFGYLIGNPLAWVDSTELRGDSILFWIERNNISTIELIGNGVILSPSQINPKNLNLILSDIFWINFGKGEIRHLAGKGNCKTSYFIESDKEGINLANYSSDSLKIYFNDGKVVSISWYGRVYGEVIPDKIFSPNLKKFYNSPSDYLILKPRRLEK